MQNRKKTAAKTSISNNPSFQFMTVLYIAVLLFFSMIACFFSYKQKKEELLSQLDMTFLQLEQEYIDILDNFWQIYMPLFESHGSNYVNSVLVDYFITSRDQVLEPLKRLDLSQALSQLMMRNSQIQWLALYSGEREVNYIQFHTGNSLQVLPPDFPYLDNIAASPSRMSVYGMEPISDSSDTLSTYAICGGVPNNMGTGKIIVGFSISSMEQICKNSSIPLSTLNYRLTSEQDILFDSNGYYEKDTGYSPMENLKGVMKTPDGRRLYVRSKISGNKTSVISYTVSWWELFRYAHSYTIPILLIVFLFAGLSIVLYTIMLKMITQEVNTIRDGLDLIGENHLEYRISTDFKQSGLPEIAESINHMTVRLHENINRAYYYELRQKEAELSELQAKFNPHFLYNSLEMLRSRCYQNGDGKTADLITQLAAIFRGFIGSQTFIPLRDELTFSKRYLTLFGARYGDQVQVLYDIDTEILRFGIIRNVFQPLIENYFVHGFDSSEEANYILFRGKSLDERTMAITVEDNGSGMGDEEIRQLNARLHEPIKLDTESYGLKNLHQRLLLFYGENCGLDIMRNDTKGIRIQMTLLKMTCDEYEENRKKPAEPGKK